MAENNQSPSKLIDQHIANLTDWRGETLAEVRKAIRAANPDIVEEVKWRKPSNPLGVPVWELDGIICTGETYKAKVKLTFAQGAKFADPDKLFNGNDNGNTRRSIDLFEGDEIDGPALTRLVGAAIGFNRARDTKRKV